ncbi:hypothetical protein TorRG33x02_274150, partial [Trema orientale]
MTNTYSQTKQYGTRPCLFGNGAIIIGVKLLSLPEQLVLNMLSKSTWREERWLRLRDDFRQRLEDDLFLWRRSSSKPPASFSSLSSSNPSPKDSTDSMVVTSPLRSLAYSLVAS